MNPIPRLWQQLTAGEPWRTIPNAITAGRLALLPVVLTFLALHWFSAAAATAAMVFVSDFVDGFLARRLGQQSSLGRWLDPLADRATMVVLSAGLAWAGILPLDLVILALVPDIVLAVVAAVFFRGTPSIPVSLIGKLRTTLQFSACLILIVGAVASQFGFDAVAPARAGVAMFGVGVVASFLAGMLYSKAAASQLIADHAEGDRDG